MEIYVAASGVGYSYDMSFPLVQNQWKFSTKKVNQRQTNNWVARQVVMLCTDTIPDLSGIVSVIEIYVYH